MKKSSAAFCTLALAVLLSACSPALDWRDYRSPDAPFTALFPGKPSVLTREINLDGQKVQLTMTASEAEGNTFAIGTAVMANAALAQAALPAMQAALLRNINGQVSKETASSASHISSTGSHLQTSLEMAATGSRNGQPVQLSARFVARDTRIFQIVIVGDASKLSRENIDTFMDGVKLESK